MMRILTETKYNLLLQNKELLKQEDINLTFTDEAIEEIALCNFCAIKESLFITNISVRTVQSFFGKYWST